MERILTVWLSRAGLEFSRFFFFFVIIQEVCKVFRPCLGSGHCSVSEQLPLSVPSLLALLGAIP